ncbi:hypothetical protein AB6A40_005375 [Gnathostoma spinigerum]|uniref:MADF domain-containing protein n=1 Tax=Gnathostoma spinigerum TaxID=75299 RepID=A0ABD6EG42_9BILA
MDSNVVRIADSCFNESLIREVRKNPIVYDPSHPMYGNAVKKQETWADIACRLGEKVEAVKTRWRTLRDRYTKERRRISQNGGPSSFSYYPDLTFLDSYVIDGRTEGDQSTRRIRRKSGKMRNMSYPHTSLNVKPETFEQTSDTGDEQDILHMDSIRTDIDDRLGLPPCDEADVSTSNPERHSPHQRVLVATSMVEHSSDIAAPARKRYRPEHIASTDSVADALIRSADALQRLADRKHPLSRTPNVPRDQDECFADFVCMSLKAFDNESRVHARIAILHALAQFQT